VFANREAAGHLERALELLGRLPESAERDEQELELQTALGVPLVALHHYSGQRVWHTYRRARELCGRLGRRPSPPILRALALAGLMRSRLPDVVELGDELVRSAEASGDPIFRVEAQYVLGVARYWQGDPGAARDRLRHALDLYDPARGPSLVTVPAGEAILHRPGGGEEVISAGQGRALTGREPAKVRATGHTTSRLVATHLVPRGEVLGGPGGR
jgi:hypothetical protein